VPDRGKHEKWLIWPTYLFGDPYDGCRKTTGKEVIQMEKLLLRPDEVAELLSMGRSKVYALIASGEVPVVRIGKSVRVPLQALRVWTEEHSNHAHA
jgi:excisionase family DNA binding protein